MKHMFHNKYIFNIDMLVYTLLLTMIMNKFQTTSLLMQMATTLIRHIHCFPQLTRDSELCNFCLDLFVSI